MTGACEGLLCRGWLTTIKPQDVQNIVSLASFLFFMGFEKETPKLSPRGLLLNWAVFWTPRFFGSISICSPFGVWSLKENGLAPHLHVSWLVVVVVVVVYHTKLRQAEMENESR